MQNDLQNDLENDLREELFSGDRNLNAGSEREFHLEKVHRWLRYEGLAPGLFLGAFWLPYSLVLGLILLTAYLFTPYMVWHFWKARYYKQLIVFGVVVVIPFVASRFLESDGSLGSFFLSIVPIVAFFIFTWVMNLTIGERLSESRAVREIEHADRIRSGG